MKASLIDNKSLDKVDEKNIYCVHKSKCIYEKNIFFPSNFIICEVKCNVKQTNASNIKYQNRLLSKLTFYLPSKF